MSEQCKIAFVENGNVKDKSYCNINLFLVLSRLVLLDFFILVTSLFKLCDKAEAAELIHRHKECFQEKEIFQFYFTLFSCI